MERSTESTAQSRGTKPNQAKMERQGGMGPAMGNGSSSRPTESEAAAHGCQPRVFTDAARAAGCAEGTCIQRRVYRMETGFRPLYPPSPRNLTGSSSFSCAFMRPAASFAAKILMRLELPANSLRRWSYGRSLKRQLRSGTMTRLTGLRNRSSIVRRRGEILRKLVLRACTLFDSLSRGRRAAERGLQSTP